MGRDRRSRSPWRVEPDQTNAPPVADAAAYGTAGTAAQAETARPLALVIGNSAYPDAGLPLAQPVNSARAVADALQEKNFDVAIEENLTRSAMERAFETLKSKVRPGATVLIFFSGFGIQAARQTYLIPVNAQIWSEADVRRSGLSLEPLLAEIEAKGAGAKLLVLDASRRNPFERRFRSLSIGPAAIQAPDDSLMLYAAAPGKVVDDGEGELSRLTDGLIAQMRAPAPRAEETFNRTRLTVAGATQRAQTPWVSSSLAHDFILGSSEPAGTTRQSAR